MVDKHSLSNRREFERRKFSTRVAVLCHGQFTIETGVEVGEGGMLLRTRKQFNVGDPLEINFSVPGGGYVRCQATVVYKLEYGPGELYFGVQFIDPSTVLKLEVRQYVESR